ncbi:hypothetical protein [Methanosarcina barkeri]|uniref:hypothetical protein n=1 Tax=Methanosarcina barkeri TaxID=2208 RepID=UPI000B0B74DB|nr:hypothetical protein [Methanosarcina barkeri]
MKKKIYKNGLKGKEKPVEINKGEGKKEETEILPTLVNALKNDLGSALKDIEVKDVRIGLAYIGVLLSENYGALPAPRFTSFQAALLSGLRAL